MRFYTSAPARRTPLQSQRRSSYRLALEALEDRLVLSLADGMVLVCTGPSSYSSLDQSSVPIGIVGVDPNTGAQVPVSVNSSQDGTFFTLPSYVTEGPDGQLYVTDLQAFGTGAIIRVDPNTGQQFLVTRGQLINGPNALAWVNGFLYVANEADGMGSVHTIVQVNPNTGAQTLITDGNSGGFAVPTGMAAGPGNSIYISDEPGGGLGTQPGGVWQVNLSTGQQTLITAGNLINHPVDVTQDENGNLIVIANAVVDPSTQLARIVRVNPANPDPTGMNQSLVYTESAGYPLDGITEDLNSGTIYTGSISYATNPAELFAINPSSQTQTTLTTAENLSLVEGIGVYHPVTQSAATTTTTITPSINPATFGQSVIFTATVSPQSPGSGTPTGTVQFQIDGVNVGNQVALTTSNGVATASLSSSALSAGTHAITALYSGDSEFAASIGLLSGGEVVSAASSAAGGDVTATLNPNSGVLTISGDAGNNAITLQQATAGVLQMAGVSTSINQSANAATFSLSSVTEIDITFLNGNDSVTMKGFSIPGSISITAGSGADILSLDTITAALIHISTAGSAPDSISLANTTVGPIGISTGANASIALSGIRSTGLVNILAGSGVALSVNNLTDTADLEATLGDHAQSLTIKGSSCANVDLLQTGSTGSTLFDLENDTVKGNLNLNVGDGNDTLVLSHVNVGAELLAALGAGNNTVKADHVVALFGLLNGGTSGNNNYMDDGGNSGYSVFGFIGH